MPRQNAKITFDDSGLPYSLSACNSCWYIDSQITEGRYDCGCQDEDCRLVWCVQPRNLASENCCESLRYLHEREGVDISCILEGREPTDEVLDARKRMATDREAAKLQMAMVGL